MYLLLIARSKGTSLTLHSSHISTPVNSSRGRAAGRHAQRGSAGRGQLKHKDCAAALGVDPARIAAILEAVAARETRPLSDLMAPLHAADIADLLEQISPSERRSLLQLWSGEIDGEILSEISDAIREEVIESLPPEVVAEAVRDLDTDDVVDGFFV